MLTLQQLGAGEMAKHFKTLADLQRTQFNLQYPHNGSQQSISPIPGDPTPFPALCKYYEHVVHRHICRKNTHTHIF